MTNEYNDIPSVDSGYEPPVIDPGEEPTPTTEIQDDIFKLELENLQRVQDRANFIHNVWADNYVPHELQTLAEIDAVPKQTVNIPVVSAGGINSLNQTYGQAYIDIANIQANMCYSDSCGVSSRMAVAQAKSQTWHVQADLRYEETRVYGENSQRLNDRIAMIAPGRGGVAAAMNALNAASGIYASISNQANAEKANRDYVTGRGLEFVKNNLGNIGKVVDYFRSPADVHTNNDAFRAGEIAYQNSNEYGSNLSYVDTSSTTSLNTVGEVGVSSVDMLAMYNGIEP